MNLTPHDKDKLLAAMAADVARRRLARGVKLNYAEAVALLGDFIVEGARDGRSPADLSDAGTRVLSASQVMDGIAAMIPSIEVEATFPDGVRRVAVDRPIRDAAPSLIPGETITEDDDIAMNARRAVTEIDVDHTGDRPIEIGSHYHFFEANPALRFDRHAARGKRLDIVAGATIRFEPGESRTVRLIDLDGARDVFGFRSEVMGPLDA